MKAFTISRVVVLLTPVFAALAGYVATQVARLPGAPQLDSGELTVLFVAGATTAAGAAVTWLRNRGAHERQQLGLQAQLEPWAVDTGPSKERDKTEPVSEEEDEVDDAPYLRIDRLTQADVEQLRSILGVNAALADSSRAVHGVAGLESRVDAIERPEAAAIVAAARAE